jgi:hypothetical protein
VAYVFDKLTWGFGVLLVVLGSAGSSLGAANLLQNAGLKRRAVRKRVRITGSIIIRTTYGGTESFQPSAGNWRKAQRRLGGRNSRAVGSYYETESAYWQKVPVTPGKILYRRSLVWADSNWYYSVRASKFVSTMPRRI